MNHVALQHVCQKFDRYEDGDPNNDNFRRATYPVEQFDLMSMPNDFNTQTMVSFIESETSPFLAFNEIMFGTYNVHPD